MKWILKTHKRFKSWINSILFHDKHSMSIGRLARIKAKNKIRLIARIPLPKKWCEKQYLEFTSQIMKTFGGKEVFKRFRRLDLADLKLLQLKCIQYGMLADPTDEDVLWMFKKYYQRNWKDDKDTERIHVDIERLEGKRLEIINQVGTSEDVHEDDFYKTIAEVEYILKQDFNQRRMSVHTFEIKHQQALDYVKALKDSQHGR